MACGLPKQGGVKRDLCVCLFVIMAACLVGTGHRSRDTQILSAGGSAVLSCIIHTHHQTPASGFGVPLTGGCCSMCALWGGALHHWLIKSELSWGWGGGYIFPLTLQGQAFVAVGVALLTPTASPVQTHTPNGQQAWSTLLRATSCVCVSACVCVCY